MKDVLKTALALGCFASLTLTTQSCASIVSRSKYDVTINSVPTQSIVRVLNRKGVEVAAGQTPVTLRLKASEGFFRPAKYTLVFTKEGYEEKHFPIKASLKPWYFGNLIFGGIIGFLIVDPATGAMWKINDEMVSTSLTPLGKPVAVIQEEKSNKEINVYALSDIPQEMRSKMIRVK